jgi:hypothetical protein
MYTDNKMVTKELPLSGSEKKFTTRLWNKYKASNNCYAYAVNDPETYRWQKSIPGDRSGMSNMYHSYTHCKGLPQRVISDNPKKVYKVKPVLRCKKGFFKIMMFTSPQGDFHFYKQHGVCEYKVQPGNTVKKIAAFFKVPEARINAAARRVGGFKVGKRIVFKVNLWSHKRGWSDGGALLTDAKGKMIKDPRKAARDYPGLNYSNFCSAFCVKDRGIKVGKTHPKVAKK